VKERFDCGSFFGLRNRRADSSAVRGKFWRCGHDRLVGEEVRADADLRIDAIGMNGTNSSG
jgi:hypothetical protein